MLGTSQTHKFNSLDQESWRNSATAKGFRSELQAGVSSRQLSPKKMPLFRSRSSRVGQTTSTDGAGNSLTTARDLGALSTARTLQDVVGLLDTDDYYRFTVSRTSLFQSTLEGSGGDAGIELLDRTGKQLAYADKWNSNAEAMSYAITAGTYYIRVRSGWLSTSDTTYDLRLSAAAIATDGAGNTLNTARNLNTLSGTRTFNDYVGRLDTNDYYRFSLSQMSEFNLKLDALLANADVTLLDNAGQFITSSYNSGTKSESMQRILAAGTYYVQVKPAGFDNEDTTYRLNLTATAIAADTAGNTLETARNIGTLTTPQRLREFVGSIDTNDYYRLNLSQSRTLELSAKVSDYASLEVLDSTGRVIRAGSASSYRNAEPTKVSAYNLAAGTYYVRVSSFSSPGTTYDLTLTPVAPTPDLAGDTLASARNMGILNGNQSFQELVGAQDTNDYYRFQVNQNSQFHLSLGNVTEITGVDLLDSQGRLIEGAVTNFNTKGTTLQKALTSGTYYLRIYPGFSFLNTITPYDLGVIALPTLSGEGFSPNYGYGLVNAAAAVARSLGQTSFPDVPNLGGDNWGNDLVNAPEVWARGYTGQNVVVAVVDTGVDYLHNDLDGNIWTNTREIAGNGLDDDRNGFIDDIRGWDFINADNDPMDDQSHGTHVAGTIAAENNGFGVTGVAYNAKIMPVKVLSEFGSGSNEAVAAGIRYAADNGADVINLSLGSDTHSAIVEAAVQYASSKGSFVVMAAGNSSGLAPGYPAHHALLWGMAVGAVDQQRQLAYFSNRPGTDANMRYIVAPGVDVKSTVPGNDYASYDGTSMAAPHMSGVAALMLSANPTLTPEQLRNLVINSATRMS